MKFRANVQHFTWHFVPRTMKFRLKFRLGKRNFRQNLVWQSKISCNSCLGGRNFVHHFMWGSEILWNILFVGVEINLNKDEIKKSCA